MKTLYFEGAGMEGTQRNDVENCRIRTAFTNDKGEKIYLELGGTEVTKYTQKLYNFDTCVGYVDSCHYITGGKDDENENAIFRRNREVFEYTKQNILNFVNKKLNCSFDSVIILGDLSGYQVFKEDKKSEKYNYGDEFQHDKLLEELRSKIFAYFYNLEKSEGKQYPNFSLWVDENDKHLLHLLRHFNGYNKHWSIRTDVNNWEGTIKETKLGKYAC